MTDNRAYMIIVSIILVYSRCDFFFISPSKAKLNVFFICSGWVIGNREDLVKNIIADIKPEHGEVIILCALRVCLTLNGLNFE